MARTLVIGGTLFIGRRPRGAVARTQKRRRPHASREGWVWRIFSEGRVLTGSAAMPAGM
jgi:hypothetical protein